MKIIKKIFKTNTKFVNKADKKIKKKDNNDLYQDLINVVNTPFIVINYLDDIIYTNNAAKNKFKLSSKHKITNSFRTPEFYENLKNFKKKKINTSEFQIELFSLPFSIIYNIKLHKLSDRKILLSFLDITELNKFENLHSDFIGNVSHELKTPLSVLLSSIELLITEKKISNKERKDILFILNKESLKMKSIIEDLLNLTKIESQFKKKIKKKINLNDVIKLSINSLITKAKKNKIKIKFISNKNNIITGDKDQLVQLVENILDNSIKYAFKNSLIQISLRSNNKNIFLIFKDKSKGIPQSLIPRLTDRFYRTPEVKTKKIDGTGLGLAIVKYIVIRHHAKLKITSKINVGSKFEIIFNNK